MKQERSFIQLVGELIIIITLLVIEISISLHMTMMIS